VAVVGAGRPGPRGRGAAGRGERSPGHVDGGVGVDVGRRDHVALGAGDGGRAERGSDEVGLVGADAAGRGGGVALRVDGRSGVERGRLRGGGAALAVAGGAGHRGDVDDAVHVARDVDGGGRVAGVAGAAVRPGGDDGVGAARRGIRRGAVAGAAGGRGGSRPARDVGEVAVPEIAVAVAGGAAGTVPRGRDAARPRQRAEGDLDGPIGVGAARGNGVAFGAGGSAGERAGDQVALVGADAAGRGGGVALRVLRRRGGQLGIEGGGGSGRVAVAGGACQVRDVGDAVHVGGEVHRDPGVAGVAVAAARGGRDGRVRCGGGQAVAGAAAGLAGAARPDRGRAGAAAKRGAVAVVGAGEGGPVPRRGGTAAPGERSPGELDGSARVVAGGRGDVALGAGHRAAILPGDQVGLVRAHAGGGGRRVAARVLGRRGRELRVQGGGRAGPVAVAGGAAERGDVDLAVQVERGIDGRRGVAGVAGGAVGVLRVRRGRGQAVAGAAGLCGGARPHRGVGRVPAGEGAVAVDVGAGGSVPGRGRSARPRERAEGHVGRAVGVGRARRQHVALGAGEEVAVAEVERVGADRARRRGGLALRALRRRGGELGIQRGIGPRHVAVAGGAGEAGDVDLAVHVVREVDGGRGVARVASRAVGILRVRSGGRQPVAGAAGVRAGGRPVGSVGGVAAGEAAVAVRRRAGGAVPDRGGSAARGEGAEGHVDLAVRVAGGGGDDVALGAGDRRADGPVDQVALVSAHGAGARGRFTLRPNGGGSGQHGVRRRRRPCPVAMAQRARLAASAGPGAIARFRHGPSLRAAAENDDARC